MPDAARIFRMQSHGASDACQTLTPPIMHFSSLRAPARLVLLLVGLVAPVLAQTSDAQVRELDAYIQKGMREWEIPGLTVSLVRNDTMLFAKGYGVRRLGVPGVVDVNTQFGIMSTTKAFTALAIAMLVDEGKVQWSDPITKHLPEFQFRDPFLTREATVKDLLTHNIGMGNADLMWARGDLSRAEILRRVRYLPTAYSLRSGFAYQNVMYGAAGALIERVSGRSWEDFVRFRIFAPLGMMQSKPTYATMRSSTGVNQSEPHFRIRDTIRVIADESVDVLPAAGAIWSNADDMANWIRFMLNGGRINGQQLVSEANFRELLKPQTMVTEAEFYPTATLTKPRWMSYGLGWFQQDYRGRFLAFHTGSLDGRTAMVALLPDARTGVFIAGNLDHAEFRHALMLKALDIFAGTNGGAPRDWSTEFLALYAGLRDKGVKARAELEAKRISGTKPSLALASYAATYTHPAWGDLVVAEQGGALSIAMGSSASMRGMLEHWNTDTFRAMLGDGRSAPMYVAFTVDASGKVARLIMDGSDEYVFTRVEAR